MHMHVHMYTYIYVYIHICIHIHILIYVYIHTFVCIYSQVRRQEHQAFITEIARERKVGLFCSLAGLFCLYIGALLTLVHTSGTRGPAQYSPATGSRLAAAPRGWGASMYICITYVICSI